MLDCLLAVINDSNSPRTALDPSATQAPDASAEGKHILVADGSILNQKVALHQLRKLGYSADAVANGYEALEALSRTSYDLVFMDCQLPAMDGYEAGAHPRKSEDDFNHPPIVAMSADSLIKVSENSAPFGMDDYISKPIKIESLSRILEKYFPAINA